MKRASWFVLGGLLVSLLLAGVVSNFASAAPDGLDSASTRGCTLDEAGEITGGTCMARNARDHELADSPLADYAVRGVADERLATGLSGVAGVLLTFAVGGGLFWLARRRRPAPAGGADLPSSRPASGVDLPSSRPASGVDRPAGRTDLPPGAGGRPPGKTGGS